MSHILAIDQGTTSSRAIIFDAGLRAVADGDRSQREGIDAFDARDVEAELARAKAEGL